MSWMMAKRNAKEWMQKEQRLMIAIGFLWYFVTLSFIKIGIDPINREVSLMIMDMPLSYIPLNSASWLITKVSMATLIYTILVQYPFEYAFSNFYFGLYRDHRELNGLLRGFKDGYNRIISTLLLRDILVTIGLICFFVPGITLACAFKFVPYLLKEYPEMSQIEILKESFRLTKGHRMQLLLLDLSFVGWQLLAALGLNVLQMYWMPYQKMAEADYYRTVKQSVYQNG